MKTGHISRPYSWPIVPGDAGWPRSLRLDPAGPIMADAVVTLVHNRGGTPLDNAGALLQALMDLINAGAASIPDAVAEARDQRYSWNEISAMLGIDANIAERRSPPYCEKPGWLNLDD